MGDNRVANFYQFIVFAYFIGIGIACIVLYQNNLQQIEFYANETNYPRLPNTTSIDPQTPTCGLHGTPPLPAWVKGTGISYIILGSMNGIVGLLLILSVVGIVVVFIVGIFGGIFVFIWQIMGAVTLWRDNGGCANLIYPIWAVAMAVVIGMFGFWVIQCCFGNYIKREED